jgi:hypothetical protein
MALVESLMGDFSAVSHRRAISTSRHDWSTRFSIQRISRLKQTIEMLRHQRSIWQILWNDHFQSTSSRNNALLKAFDIKGPPGGELTIRATSNFDILNIQILFRQSDIIIIEYILVSS